MSTRETMQAKVRAILERANHPNTPQAEAETALALAFRLMQKESHWFMQFMTKYLMYWQIWVFQQLMASYLISEFLQCNSMLLNVVFLTIKMRT